MIGSDACTVVAVKILIEEQKITPGWVLLELFDAPMNGSASLIITEKDMGEPMRDFCCNLL